MKKNFENLSIDYINTRVEELKEYKNVKSITFSGKIDNISPMEN